MPFIYLVSNFLVFNTKNMMILSLIKNWGLSSFYAREKKQRNIYNLIINIPIYRIDSLEKLLFDEKTIYFKFPLLFYIIYYRTL